MIPFEEVYRAYLEEGTQRKAAIRLGIEQSQVSLILRSNCIHAMRGQNNPKKCDPQRVYADYLKLKNQYLVAQKHGLAQGTVSRILRNKFGIGLGAKMLSVKPTLPTDQIVSRYRAGESCKQISVDYSVSWSTIRNILILNRVPRRTLIEAAHCGPDNHNWKGQKSYYPGDRARVAAERHEGKRLLPGTVVHHHNEDAMDNSPMNLWVFPNLSCHALYHHALLKTQRKGLTADSSLLALENGGVPLLKPDSLSESEHSIKLLSLFGMDRK